MPCHIRMISPLPLDDVVTLTRRCVGCFDSELDHLRWYVAFRISRERQFIAQYRRRRVNENLLDEKDFAHMAKLFQREKP